jgi:hypothetical protein
MRQAGDGNTSLYGVALGKRQAILTVSPFTVQRRIYPKKVQRDADGKQKVSMIEPAAVGVEVRVPRYDKRHASV